MSADDPFDQIERLVDQLGGIGGDGIAVDMVERDETIEVTADLPGYEPGNIDVELHDDGRLEINATRETATEEASGTVHRQERRQETVSRTVTLPAAVDADEAEASYTNGVVTVRLPTVADDDDGTAIDVS